MITIGLKMIQVGTASEAGTMPNDSDLKKMGKVYKDSATLTQEEGEETEHFEENNPIPEFSETEQSTPVLEFDIMNADVDFLVEYMGGTKKSENGKDTWIMASSPAPVTKALRIISKQGLNFDMPNALLSARLNNELNSKGINLVHFKVKPLATTANNAFQAWEQTSA